MVIFTNGFLVKHFAIFLIIQGGPKKLHGSVLT